MRRIGLIRFGFLTCLLVLTQAVHPALAERICDTADQMICVETQTVNGQTTFIGINRFKGQPVTLVIDVTTENLKVSSGRIDPVVLPGNTARQLFTLSPRGRGDWHYDYRFRWSRGDFTARHDDSHLYHLPFPKGTRYRLIQSCNGDFSHHGAQRYALDFVMPEGTPIAAARDGVVVFVAESSNRGGPSEALREYDNRVVIQHSDRTLGIYAHLRKNGVLPEVGARVRAGEVIGYSGNTGYSTGPHLHFMVTKGTTVGEDQSIEVRFASASGTVSCPREGVFLQP
jgi:murein DD-endopeptidase MepM/ murein hydrolase activator NlpD